MAALLKLVPVSQITYGTDYPYYPLDQIDKLRQLNLAAADLEAIAVGNACRLMPRLSA
jgi:predicted TIM-barrel fold metal-dependent hydrolase